MASGNFLLQVRVVDVAGQMDAWSHLVSAGRTLQLDLAGTGYEPTFRNGKTIAQLIASGKYRVTKGTARKS